MIEPAGQWYIDAIDPLAGLCFASHRTADLNQDVELDLAGVYISPPQFQPEPVASRGISFAAARGGFQLGLFIDEEEVAFPNLPSLVEFVRRCYIFGGRTDGSGGRGPLPVPPRPDGGEGGFRPLFAYGGEGSGGLAAVMRALQTFSATLDQAGDVPIPVTNRSKGVHISQSGASSRNDDDAIVGAAATLIAELLERMPRPKISDDWKSWVECAARLRQAIGSLGLQPEILARYGHELIELSERAARRTGRDVRQGSDLYFGPMHLLLQYFGLPIDDHPWHVELWYYWRNRSGAGTDPMDDLSCWPLPPWLELSGATTVFDLLSAMTGSPKVVQMLEVQAAAIALFAALHIINRPLSEWPPETKDGAISRARQKQVMLAADWLLAQFPRFAYPPAIEKLIASVGT